MAIQYEWIIKDGKRMRVPKKPEPIAQPDKAIKAIEEASKQGAFDLGKEAVPGDTTVVNDVNVGTTASETSDSGTEGEIPFSLLTHEGTGRLRTTPILEDPEAIDEILFGDNKSTLLEEELLSKMSKAERDAVRERKLKNEDEQRFLDTQNKIATQAEDRQFKTAGEELKASTASMTEQFSPGREMPMSFSNSLLAEEFRTKVADDLNQKRLQVDQARLKREQYQIQLKEARDQGNEELAADIARAIQKADTAQKKAEAALVDSQREWMNTAAQIRNQAFDTFETIVSSAPGSFADLAPADIASMFNIDVGTASVMKAIDSKIASSPERAAELQKAITEARYAGMTAAQKNFITLQNIDDPVLKSAFMKILNTNPNVDTVTVDDELFIRTPDGVYPVGGKSSSGANGWSTTCPPGGCRTDRHNNPTAVMYEGFAGYLSKLGYIEGVDFFKGEAFPDNENYHTVKFKDAETGIQAAIDLIDNYSFYTGAGKQRWTHTAMTQKEWNVLTQEQKRQVVKEMYRKEGGNGILFGEENKGGLLDELIFRWENGTPSDREKIIDTAKENGLLEALINSTEIPLDLESYGLVAAAGLPTRIRDSEREMERFFKVAKGEFEKGTNPLVVADIFMGFSMGYIPEKDQDLAIKLRLLVTDTDFPIPDIARLITEGDYNTAITKVENKLMEQVGGTEAKVALPIETVQKGRDILKLLDEVDPDLLGPWDSVEFKFVQKPFAANFPNATKQEIEKATKLQAKITAFVAPYRLENLGSAVTPTEEAFLRPLLPGLIYQENINKIIVQEFMNNVIAAHNAARRAVALPDVNEDELVDVSKRIPLYSNFTPQTSTTSSAPTVPTYENVLEIYRSGVPANDIDSDNYDNL